MNGAMKKRSIPELVVLATGSAQNLEDHKLFPTTHARQGPLL